MASKRMKNADRATTDTLVQGLARDVVPMRTSRVRLVVAWILAPVLLFLCLAGWAFSSPAGSSPDDDFHLASIWCGDGIRPGLCENDGNPVERVVPTALAKSYCYIFTPERSAACQGDWVSTDSGETGPTLRGNWSGDYPPVFYSVMGLFASGSVGVSIIAMRLFNILLFVGLTACLYLLLPVGRRPALVGGLAITMVPLGMFLVPSTNPSSWAIISAGTLWIALLGYFESHGRRKLALGVIATVSTVIGASARADAAVYAVIAVAAVTILCFARNRTFIVALILPAALVAISAGFFFAANQSSFAANGLPSGPAGAAPADPGWMYLLTTNFLNVPHLWADVFGSGPLGWLDTNLPAVVWVTGLAVFCGVTFSGLRSLPVRKGVALAGIAGALWLIPTYILVRSNTTVGFQVQPRYLLPLIIVLAGVALLPASGMRLDLTRTQRVLVICGLSGANAVALHVNIRRYVTGLDVTSWNLNAHAEWWWRIPVEPMSVWLIGSLAFAGCLCVMAWLLRGSANGTLRDVQHSGVSSIQTAPTIG
ncbi:DUF2142 domain-containing protein [Cryobacterium sp. 5I3]|uniref:DUF2142 domain-containing protein n=1 Tax=Cryobacterium sp. 5I3 TaxID=3048592 RepID=UPI002B225C7F|nr:DUF2142 domain-containing protein [Cryobacterium sp. 5I3]MEB0201770.1 DUF2142 domain-containing protein [Cryobacterium sp. 5I3]